MEPRTKKTGDKFKKAYFIEIFYHFNTYIYSVSNYLGVNLKLENLTIKQNLNLY